MRSPVISTKSSTAKPASTPPLATEHVSERVADLTVTGSSEVSVPLFSASSSPCSSSSDRGEEDVESDSDETVDTLRARTREPFPRALSVDPRSSTR